MRRALSLFAAVAAWLVVGCASLPALEGRTVTAAPLDTAETRLGRAVAPGSYDTEPGASWLLRTGVGVLSVLPIEWLL